MALWGSNDNLVSSGTVSLDYTTKVVTGSGTTFGSVGFGTVGDVIRFGVRGNGGTYFGDAVISKVTSATNITIASTDGLSGAAIAATDYYLSQLPKSSVLDSSYSETQTGYDKNVYGISTTTAYAGVSTKYRTNGTGWVGVTTYTDVHGNLRVKSEILVASSGITTGANGIAYPTEEA